MINLIWEQLTLVWTTWMEAVEEGLGVEQEQEEDYVAIMV